MPIYIPASQFQEVPLYRRLHGESWLTARHRTFKTESSPYEQQQQQQPGKKYGLRWKRKCTQFDCRAGVIFK